MSRTAAHNWAWRDFWRAGRAASCLPGDSANEAEILAHWRAVFGGCADGSRILDIATGNGIVLRQAQAAATETERRFELTGIDLARIDPRRHTGDAALESIRFLGGIDAKRLPFAEAEFDVVASQYGLEYADLEPALGEAGRVLRVDGRLEWLAHSPESIVVRQNRAQHGEVDLLLAADGPLAAMERLVKTVARKRRPERAMAKLDATIRVAEQYCRQHPPAGIVREVCNGLADLANHLQSYRPQDLAGTVRHSRNELLAYRQRLKDMEAAALTPERIVRVRGILNGCKWEALAIEPLKIGGSREEIGLVVRARRVR